MPNKPVGYVRRPRTSRPRWCRFLWSRTPVSRAISSPGSSISWSPRARDAFGSGRDVIVDEVYSYVFANPQLDFSAHGAIDLDAFGGHPRQRSTTASGALVDELVEQIDSCPRTDSRQHGPPAQGRGAGEHSRPRPSRAIESRQRHGQARFVQLSAGGNRIDDKRQTRRYMRRR